MTWGDLKFFKTFPDEKTLADNKRDWAADLLTAIKARRGHETEEEYIFRMKDRVDVIFKEIRLLADGNNQAWDWPNLKKIAGFMNNYRQHAAHQMHRRAALPDLGKQERNKKAGAAALDQIKSMDFSPLAKKPKDEDEEES